MLRISLQESGDSLRLILEGRLIGPWVNELRQVWDHHSSRYSGQQHTVDLSGVTAMDRRGQEILHEFFQCGATLLCSDVLNQYFVELISHSKKKAMGACQPCHSGEVTGNLASGRN